MTLTAHLQHQSLRRKMIWALLPALMGTAILGTMAIRQEWSTVDTAQQELQGLQPARRLLQVVRLTQQHRGLSGAWLSGDATVQAQRSQRQHDVDAAMQALPEALAAADLPPDTRRAWPQLVDRWQALSRSIEHHELSAKDAMAAHTQLIQDELMLLDQVLYDAALILDPAGDGYSLVVLVGQHLPAQAERMAQMRGRGSAMLASHVASADDASTLQSLIGQAQQTALMSAASLRHVQSFNPAIGEALAVPAKAAEQETNRLIALLRKQVIDADALTMAPSEFFQEATRAIDAQYALLDQAATALEQLLIERHDSACQRAWAALVGVALFGLTSAWLAVRVARQLVLGLRKAVAVSEDLAHGKLDTRLEIRGSDEVARLLHSMAQMQQALRGIVQGVRSSVEQVSTTSDQIASGNASLEDRTAQQAHSVVQTTQTMQAMNQAVSHSASLATDANALAAHARDLAERGGHAVRDVVSTMDNIQTSAHRIADIIGVIDGIAFQTNILALNASVEAARAGDQGRGFAVVAGEVRNLAQRSASAAQEIKQLIAESGERVANGSMAVHEAGRTIDDVVKEVREVSALVQQITASSQQQARDIQAVCSALSGLDEHTQRNAELVQQSATVAQHLHDQAQQLAGNVSFFQMRDARG